MGTQRILPCPYSGAVKNVLLKTIQAILFGPSSGSCPSPRDNQSRFITNYIS